MRSEVHKVHLETGDALLICSDGLTNMVPEDAIAGVLGTAPDAEQACKRLVARANEAGGEDNITAVVARFEEAA